MISKKKIEISIKKFLYWKERFGDISYDRMDFWSSKLGIFSKKLFYKNKFIGSPLAIYGLLLENFLPSLQKYYGRPNHEVIGDANFSLGFLNLFEYSKDDKYIKEAKKFINIIMQTYTNGYSGYCWGYSFGWQTRDGYWKAGIPLITITPYAFWAFKRYYELTGNNEYKKICLSIAEFAVNDLKITEMPNGTFCSSYSPSKKDVVINANAYRAALLLGSYQLWNNKKFLNAANKNIDFILSYQGENGEWFYEAKEPNNNFIDNFHTCFILKNLFKCYQFNKDNKILLAVQKGYNYYIENLFYKNNRPKHFSKSNYMKLRKYEMYDYAEGILLGHLLRNHISNAYERALWLANDLIDNFQTTKGYFLTRVTSLNTKHKIQYLRWPQAKKYPFVV